MTTGLSEFTINLDSNSFCRILKPGEEDIRKKGYKKAPGLACFLQVDEEKEDIETFGGNLPACHSR